MIIRLAREDELERICFESRYGKKKVVNLIVGALIIAMCVFALIRMASIDREGLLMLRWMTVDGTFFVTFYAVIILSLIGSGVIKREYIPYGFLDIKAMSIQLIIATIVVFYIMGYYKVSSERMWRKY